MVENFEGLRRQHKSTQQNSVWHTSKNGTAVCRNQARSDECRYAECRGAIGNQNHENHQQKNNINNDLALAKNLVIN